TGRQRGGHGGVEGGPVVAVLGCRVGAGGASEGEVEAAPVEVGVGAVAGGGQRARHGGDGGGDLVVEARESTPRPGHLDGVDDEAGLHDHAQRRHVVAVFQPAGDEAPVPAGGAGGAAALLVDQRQGPVDRLRVPLVEDEQQAGVAVEVCPRELPGRL